MGGLLTHSLRDDIVVAFDLGPELWPVRVDEDQFQIALINLAANARDAMPHGGTLSVRSRNVPATEEVCLAVRDTGVGMDPEVAARVFEPFFTTKERGKGTGLGLAQVYGFVHQSGGRLALDSTPGDGTTVSLFFPRSNVPPEAAGPKDLVPSRIRPGLRVLVVDDNHDIAVLATTALEEQGCTTRRAHTAAEALDVLREASFDVLLTDIVMPGEWDGLTLARLARAMAPAMALVVMTGYSERLESGETIEAELLLKPFSPKDLMAALQRALDSHAAGRSRLDAGAETA
jgi:CheY-like chemotaxis protein